MARRQLPPICSPLGVLVAVLAFAPAAGAARPQDPLQDTRLGSVVSSLEISLSRCPEPAAAPSPKCEHVRLTSSFRAGPAAVSRRTRGALGFPSGLRVSGSGTGVCESESAFPDPVVAPGGDISGLGSAVTLRPLPATSSDYLVSADRRGARWGWRDPLRPLPACRYFDDGWSAQLPADDRALPAGLASRRLTPRELRRRSFRVPISGTRAWRDVEDGGATRVFGEARWETVLTYRRPASR